MRSALLSIYFVGRPGARSIGARFLCCLKIAHTTAPQSGGSVREEDSLVVPGAMKDMQNFHHAIRHPIED